MEIHTDIKWHQDPESLGMRQSALEEGVRLLSQGCREGRHEGAQVYVGRHGKPVVEYALGQAAPGRPMTRNSMTAWFSACKPMVAMAMALLYDRGLIGLDDPIQRYLPAFASGKEACTIRHVLTHTGGFAGSARQIANLSWDDVIQAVCAYPAEYPPGTRAGYHSISGWFVLGEVLRLVDGRMIDRFLAEEIFAPLGITESRMGIPEAEQTAMMERLALVQLGKTEREHYADQASLDQRNHPAHLARVDPSGGVRGPARELGRFYDWLLAGGEWEGRAIVDRRTVELFTACHRWGLPDATLAGAPLAWGLGFGKHGNADIHRDYSRRVFNHSGMVSSVALGDPEFALSCVVVTTGLLDPMTNARRLREITGSAITAITGNKI